MTDKKPYKLPPRLTIPAVKRMSFPKKLIFVDTESTKVSMGGRTTKHVLKLGHAIYWRRPKGEGKEIIEHDSFTVGGEFWEWVARKINKRDSLYIFAHNLTFDFLVLEGFRLLPQMDFTLSGIYHKFTTTIIRFSNGSKKMVLADTQNYFPGKLEELGRSVGIEKNSIDFERCTEEELAEYCKRDTEIIYQAIRKLIDTLKDNELGPFRLSAPSLAHAIYRHKFMQHKIVTSHVPEIVEFEKSSYSGGYVAVNHLLEPGRPDVYKLDVNSMYPSVMATEDYPVYITDATGPISLRQFEIFMQHYAVIADVTLSARSPFYLMRYTGGYCYPTGTFRTVLTTPLLRKALDNDEVIQVHKLQAYQKAPIFQEFVTFMYQARQKALLDQNRADALFYKKMANSLYGKFGQSSTETRWIAHADPDEFSMYDAQDAVTGKSWREMTAGGSVVWITQEGEARYSFYAIAAHVVDYAKVKLFDLMQMAGMDHVFYTDTDSLITDGYGYGALREQLSEYELGKLKVEASGILYAGFSKKDYLIGGVRRLKGFPETMKPPETNVFEMMTHSSIWGAARRQLSGGAFWHDIVRKHNPYVLNAVLGKQGALRPLDMDKEGDSLGVKVFTRQHVRGLATYMLTRAERELIGPWLEI